jgi:autotransporter translocation and assembly factor TamB
LKGLRRAVLRLLLFLVVVLCAAPCTEWGTRFLLRGAERVLPLTIEYSGGSLVGGLRLARLRYAIEGLQLDLREVEAELELACLWRSTVCFRQLQAQSLDIVLLPDPGAAENVDRNESTAAEAQLIEFPLALEADSLNLGTLSVRWQDGEWRQGSLKGHVRVHESAIEVLSARIVQPELILQQSATAVDATQRRITLPRIDLPLELSVNKLQLVRPVWNFYGSVHRQDMLLVAGHWSHSTLQLHTVRAAGSELGDVSLRGALEFTGDWPLEADGEIELAKALQYSDVMGRKVRLSAQGSLASLALRLDCPGTVGVGLTSQVNVLDTALPFSATLTGTSAADLPLADIPAIPAFLAQAKLEFPVTFAASGSKDSQQFVVQGAASGLGYDSLELALGGKHEQGKVTIDELSARDSAGPDELRASGELFFAQGIAWSLILQSDGLQLPPLSEVVRGRILGSFHFSGEVQEERWSMRLADVDLQGDINGLPAHVSGFAGLDSSLRLASSALQAQLNGAQLSLQSAGGNSGPGYLHLTVDDIGSWQSDSRGKVQLDAVLSPDREHIQLTGSGEKVQWRGLSFKRAALAADYRADTDHAFTLNTEIVDAIFGDLDLDFGLVQLTARGNADRQSVTLVSNGDFRTELNVTGAIRGEQWRGQLAAARVYTPVGEWRLSAPVAMQGSPAARQLTVAAHCWSHPYAQLCPGVLSLGAHGSGSIHLTGDLEILAGLLPPDLDLAGAVQAQLDASWNQDTGVRVRGRGQTGAVTFTQEFGEGESASFGWDEGEAGLVYGGDGLHIDLGIQREGRKVVALDLRLPPARQNALAGSFSVDRLQLTALAPLMPVLASLGGEVSGRVSLAGTPDQPLAYGDLRLTGGQLAMEGNPTQLDDLDLRLELQGNQAQISGRGLLGAGELQLNGTLKSQPALRLELAIEGQNHTILYPPSTELQVSESLQLNLTRDLLELTGDLTVLDGVLEFEELPEDSVSVSASVVEVDAQGNPIQESLPFDILMDLQIHIADRFRVTGKTLQGNLGGDLRVQQRPGQPLQLFGNLDTVGGEFRAYQTRLLIKRGTLNFSGPPGNPALDVRAERHISSGDVTVGVHVQGPLEDELLLDIYSEPAMSQADAMSYLVRGRGMDAGAGLDGTAAALSLASGVVNRSTLVSELNRIPGISNIEFGAQGTDADTAATVSGYLGERIYLSYGVGLYEPVNVLTARFYLRSRLWFEVVSSLENSLDLYYSFDIK